MSIPQPPESLAFFAEVSTENIVLNVVTVPNDEAHRGHDYLISLDAPEHDQTCRWIETKPDGSIRKNYASKGFTYNEEHDMFIPPKNYDSWVLNVSAGKWEAPIPYPADGTYTMSLTGKIYKWDESVTNWVELTGINRV